MDIDSLFSVKRTMTSDEGFEKVKKHMKSDCVCLGCRDYGTDFMYFVGPAGSDPSKRQFVGSPLVVNKKSGRVIEYEDSNLSGKRWEFVEVG